ncbi:MAG: hypothetical protein FJ137_07660 [Deltaproteobacteria bacterium]|nr:hypothetical protein [Deltaproteobacteria bacterium]
MIDAVAVADCATPVGGIDLSTEPEATGDVEAALATLPDRVAAAGSPTWETASLSPFLREVVAYLLESPLADLGPLSSAALAAGGPLAQTVALAFLDGDGRRPDVTTLRRGLHRFYACERRLPLSLADAVALAGGLDPATTFVVQESTPKGHPRRLTTSVDGALFAAETVLDGVVRETELVWRGRRRDGALDFLVYDHDGRLRGGSTFVTSAGPEAPAAAPYACLACHRDRADGAGFVVTFPPSP